MRASALVRVVTALLAVGFSCAAALVGAKWAAGHILSGAGDGSPPAQLDPAKYDPAKYDPAKYDAGRLDPVLSHRFRRAKAAAARAGYKLEITSGYRSWDTQLAQYERKVAETGSAAEARKLVLPPWESMHVRGRAIDVGGQKAAKWLERNGYRHGLCRRYANEWWHFEPLVTPGNPCPKLEPDASAGNPPPAGR